MNNNQQGSSSSATTTQTTPSNCGGGVECYYQYLLDFIENQIIKNASPLKIAMIGSTLSLFLLTLYYSRKLSTPTMIFRSVLSCFVFKNKLIGMKVRTAEETAAEAKNDSLLYIGSIIRPSWKSLDIEAQTISSLVAFSSAKSGQHLLDKYGLRRAMQHQILFPPISNRNTIHLERISSLRNSVFAKLKQNESSNRVLMYIHGGGGFGNSCDGLQASSMVEYLNGRNDHAIGTFFSVAYRLIGLDEQERKDVDKFASTLEEQIQDCFNAYLWLLQQQGYDPKDIVFMGDSFGGALVTNLLSRIGKELGIEKQPCMAVTLSGFFDTSIKTLREHYTAEDSVICAPNNIDVMEELYSNIPSSLVPINFDANVVSTFKDTKLLIVYSNHEECTAENKLFVSTLMQAQHPSVTVIAQDGHVHGYPLFHSYSPCIRETMDKIVNLISQ